MNESINENNLKTQIVNLRTQALVTPLGIDCKSPSFGWEMSTDRPGAMQKAYRILVSKQEDFSSYVWDSERLSSSCSHSIPYDGECLLASTRYYWQVMVWDENDCLCTSSVSWFETGLMGNDESVWDQAKWIGADKTTTNTAALTTYMLTTDFMVEPGNTVGIVLSARNKDNYVLFEVDPFQRILTAREFCDNAWDGSSKEGSFPTAVTLGNADGYPIDENALLLGREDKWNRISILVENRSVTVTINNRIVIDKEENFMPFAGMFVPRRSCLLSVGFKQLNSRAFYNNLIISNPQTGDIYQEEGFDDDSGIFSVLGSCQNGVLLVEDRFELACPVPAVNLLSGIYLPKEVKSARLYASARGFYSVKINAKPVDENFFHPGFTDYRLRIPYQTFDVSSLLHSGVNRILAIVAKGYYSGYCGYSGPMKYGEQNSFIAKLLVTYEDGESEAFVTNESWLYSDKGPVVDSDYLDGESYDARLEPIGWEREDYRDNRWRPCGILPAPDAPVPTNGSFSSEVRFELSAQEGPMAGIERILTPVSMTEMPLGHYVYDFGQNMVGTIRLKVKGSRGLSLKLRYGEMSYPNGEIYIKNIRSAANTDIYTLRGDTDGEVFVPDFTSHGFRYVEITGNGFLLSDNDCIISLEGLVLCNTLENTGEFSCSDPLVNKLQENIQWGQRGNSLLVFTDCPQRNERMGWTGDAQVFAPTAAFNMDIQSFMNKWLLDVRDGQLMYNKQGAVPDTAPLGGDNRPAGCAGWADACIIVPWEMYLAYGDKQILEDNYECMKNWVAYQSLPYRQNFGLRTVNGVEVPDQSDLALSPYIQVQQSRGDHLTFDESTPFILTATAYAAYVARLLSKIAGILGEKEDEARYLLRFVHIRQAFREAWVQPDGSLAYWGEMSKNHADSHGCIINQTRYSNEKGNSNHPSQTAYALAIDFDLMPAETMEHTRQCFVQSIKDRDNHLSVGFLGISHLLPALSKCGENELAFALMEQKGNPGWLYSVINGATTIWERWNSYIAETGTFGDVSMNSFNHYAYGAIGQWLYQTVLGIRTEEEADGAGYHHIMLSPVWGGHLSYARGSYHSIMGVICSSWEKDGEDIIYQCSIPANTTASLSFPLAKGKAQLLLGDARATLLADGTNGYHLKAGTYKFKIMQ